MASLRGKLLVAGPPLVDPNFHRTVVLVCEHTPDGAMGLVLNRPSPIDAEGALPELADALDPDGTLWLGGPVETTSVVVLARFAEPAAGLLVLEDIGLVLPREDLEEVGAAVLRVRPFLGHAGWGPGQLDAELGGDDWIVADPVAADLFTESPEALWGDVLRRKGGTFRLLATMPPDPSLN